MATIPARLAGPEARSEFRRSGAVIIPGLWEPEDASDAVTQTTQLRFFTPRRAQKGFLHSKEATITNVEIAKLKTKQILGGTALGRILDGATKGGASLGVNLQRETLNAARAPEGRFYTAVRPSRVQAIEIPPNNTWSFTIPTHKLAAIVPIEGDLRLATRASESTPLELGSVGFTVGQGPHELAASSGHAAVALFVAADNFRVRDAAVAA
jgi:hypothetical protein